MLKKPVRKLDIFQVLDHISKKDIHYYRNLTEEQQKAFMPLVVMRWLSGTSSARQVVFLNELVNQSVFTSHKHKELLYFLMTICGPGHKQKYFWNKTLSKKSTTTPVAVSIVRKYFEYSTTEALEALPLLTNGDLLSYASELGTQPDLITKLKRELRSR